MVRLLLAGLLCCSGVVLSDAARADVVDMEPDNCPDGTVGATCHGGPHCAPKTCSSTCSGGKVCREVAVCTGKIGCAGMLGPDEDPSDYEVTRVFAYCAAGGGCSSGICQTMKLCMDPLPGGDDTTAEVDGGGPTTPDTGGADAGSSTVEGETTGDGCGAGRIGSFIAMSLAVTLLLLGAWFRRRDDNAETV